MPNSCPSLPLFNSASLDIRPARVYDGTFDGLIDTLNTDSVDLLSLRAWRDIFYTFLSEAIDRDQLISDYIDLAATLNRSPERDLTHPASFAVHKISRRVGLEWQRLRGLLRFEQFSDGTLYARCEPDNDIILLLASHFKSRLPTFPWIIHDFKRHKAVIYNAKTYAQVEVGEDLPVNPAPLQDKVASLWKTYYENINIKERQNHRQRKQYMPKRYWKYLPELE